jgi:hypothetical protein
VEGGGTSEEGTNRPRSVSSLLILLRAMVPLIEYGARKESCLVDLVWVGLSCQDGGGCLTLEPGFIGRAGASEGHGHGTGGEYGKTH